MSQFDGLLEIKNDKKTPPNPRRGITPKIVASPPPTNNPRTEKQTAKSKDTDFIQTSVYIKKRTQTTVKKILLDDPRHRDFSELVEELLTSWVSKNQN